MFGNILIDKLRISRRMDNAFEPFKFKVQEELKAVFSKHFRTENFDVEFDKSYFRVTFTPTLYQDEIIEGNKKPIFNMEMMDSNDLADLLMIVYKALGDEAVVTWIDLTKNILVNEKSAEYIKALSKYKVKYPYKLDECTSQTAKRTVTFGTQTRENKPDCKKGERQISFYDKSTEIKSKTKSAYRFIDDVCLTNEELEQLPEGSYEDGKLFFGQLNILRAEQKYKYTRQIKRITHYLTGSTNNDKLTLPILITMLNSNALLDELDKFYTDELRIYIFYDDIKSVKDIRITKHQQMIIDLAKEYGINLLDYQALYSEVGCKEKFDNLMKIVQPKVRDSYYEELYNKLQI